jgi:molecular chaperone DnaK
VVYTIGIDVGTSYSAAAVSRRDGGGFADPEPVVLGSRSIATASVVFVGDDGRLLVGDAAERRALTQPERVIREFKRRVGDSVPLIVDGWSHQAEDLAAIMVKWVVDRVAGREGGPAEAIAVTHPASWGPYKLALFRQALAHVGLDNVTLLSEPVAAATHYASQSRIDPGSTIAVYDLGGGTFDAAIVRKTDEHTFELLGQPEGIERLGGVDFDEAVFAHLQATANLPPLDPTDPDTVAALVRLRKDCTEAKEALSTDTETTIPVLLPQRQTRVRLVRSEFEGMVRDSLQETIAALRQAVSSADVPPEEITAVLLVGGSSRIPLIAQLISAEFGRPVAIDADPKATIALGAARTAAAAVPAPVAAIPEEATTDGVDAPPAVPVAASVDTQAHTDPDMAPEEAPVHPYEQLLALRNGLQKEQGGAFSRLPAAAVAALIAVLITAAGAFAWTATVGSSGTAPQKAQAAEDSSTPEVTTSVPISEQASTATQAPAPAPATDGQQDAAPLRDEPQEVAKNSSRDSATSPSPTKKTSSSAPVSARSASQAPSTQAPSPPPPPPPSPTTQPPAPSPSSSTTEPTSPPPPPPPPPPSDPPPSDPPTQPPTQPPPATEPTTPYP